MRFANLNILAAALSAAVLNAAAESLPFAARGFEASKRAGIMLTPVGAETWDFSGVGEVRVAVRNESDQPRRVSVAVFGEGMSLEAAPRAAQRGSRIPPHAVRTIAIPLNDTPYATDEPVTLTGMLGKPPALRSCPISGKWGESRCGGHPLLTLPLPSWASKPPTRPASRR